MAFTQPDHRFVRGIAAGERRELAKGDRAHRETLTVSAHFVGG